MKKVFLLFSLFFVFISCEQKEADEIIPSEDSGIESNVFKFEYKGSYYESEFELIDSTMILKDKNVEQLLQEIGKLPEMATMVYSDGSIEYFDTHDELLKSLDAKPILPTRIFNSYINSATLKVYDRTKCKGAYYQFDLHDRSNSTKRIIEIPNLSKINMDLKISSMDQLCKTSGSSPNSYIRALATFYSDVNYWGHSITFESRTDIPHIYIHYFGSYRMPTGEKWNDRPRSLVWQLRTLMGGV